MSEQNPIKQSWWTTLPGIITSIAALITAIVGLIAALNSTGFFKPSAATNSQMMTGTAENEYLKLLVDSISSQMIYIQGGNVSLYMGFKQGKRPGTFVAIPDFSTTVVSFYLSKYEITQGQWIAIMGSNPSHNTECMDCPVENISYDDMQGFLEKLNQLSGKHYRLPNDAEWHFAARDGISSNQYKFSGSNLVNEVAWYQGNSQDKTHPVGTKKPNELGLYDMSGNVSETCLLISEKDNRLGDAGGSYDDESNACAVSRESENSPYMALKNTERQAKEKSSGFRIAIDN